MTPEAKRLAIAEACGAKRRHWHSASHWFLSFDKSIPLATESWCDSEGKRCHWIDTLPDYLNDLNAMHKAEKTLKGVARHDYFAHLHGITGHKKESSRSNVATATAAQRAEAFLRTLGLFKE